MADVLLHAYAESGVESNWIEKDKKGEKQAGAEPDDGGKQHQSTKGRIQGRADAVIICGGTLRGDSQYGPGKITLGDILGKEIH